MGDAALLVEVEGAEAARWLAGALAADRRFAGCDVVSGLGSVLVVLDRAVPELEQLEELEDLVAELTELGGEVRTPAHAAAGPSAEIVLPTVFDGPDLPVVAALAGVGAGELVEELVAAELRVEAVGFSPGFAYLAGLPDFLGRIPRRPRPRAVVPAGSVGLANGFAAVYPQPTPGGWQLIGRTGRRLFDPTTPPFAVLFPGDRVRLVPGAEDPAGAPGSSPVPPPPSPAEEAGGPEVRTAPPARPPLRPPDGLAPRLVVEDPGLLTTVQDAGRVGLAHLGVPRAGPADPVSHRLANELVGNPAGAAALEVTARGPTLRFRAAAYVAAVGGGLELSLDGRPVEAGRVVPVGAGQRLVLGRTRLGARGYLAVGGGFRVPDVMGSGSTDTLCGLGPGPLRAGDQLGVGSGRGLLADHLRPGAPVTGDGPRELRVLLGPDLDWFGRDLPDQLRSARFVVGGSSNRVGIRLNPVDGGTGIPRLGGEVDSRGMVTGAVQVPPDGGPVVLLPDHATLGGYPVAAVVVSADLGVLGQCRPGDEVRLVPVGAAEAWRARRDLERILGDAVAGRYPVLPA